jgi:ABC-type glycerol-3-phosphate transport system permease component
MSALRTKSSRIFWSAAGQSALILWTLLALVPFAFIILLSLRSNQGIFTKPLSVSGPYVFNNYQQAWDGPPGTAGMIDYFTNTLEAAVVTLAVALTLGSAAAYFTTRLAPRAQRWVLRTFLVGTVVPFVLIIIPLYQGYNYLNILNDPATLGIAYGALALPTTVLIMYSFYTDFPKELVEAAEVDGLSDYAVYLRIVLPLSKAALSAVGIITLVYVWSEAQVGIVLLEHSQNQTVAVGVLGFQGTYLASFGPMFAGLSLATAPVIILYLVFHRYVTKGIALGGVFR